MKTWSYPLARIAGVEFRLHITFFFLLFFVLLYDGNFGTVPVILRGLALTAMVLIAVLFHELGHVIVSTRFGSPVRGTILLPTGGIPMVDPNSLMHSAPDIRREFRIAMAGPLVNLALASASASALIMLRPPAYLFTRPFIDLSALPRSFFWINLGLFAINLLPAFPLDGGRVFRAWRSQTHDMRTATRHAVNLAHLFAAGFMFAGVVSSKWLMITGLILFMAAQIEERTAMFQSVAEAVQMGDIMLTQFSFLSPADTLEDALTKAVHSLQDDFPVVSGVDLVGVITRQTIVERLRREGNGYVQGAMNRAFEIAAKTESLASGFRKLTSRGLTLIPVVDEERLVGIVTLQNLMHSMGLLAESRRLRRQAEQES